MSPAGCPRARGARGRKGSGSASPPPNFARNLLRLGARGGSAASGRPGPASPESSRRARGASRAQTSRRPGFVAAALPDRPLRARRPAPRPPPRPRVTPPLKPEPFPGRRRPLGQSAPRPAAGSAPPRSPRAAGAGRGRGRRGPGRRGAVRGGAVRGGRRGEGEGRGGAGRAGRGRRGGRCGAVARPFLGALTVRPFARRLRPAVLLQVGKPATGRPPHPWGTREGPLAAPGEALVPPPLRGEAAGNACGTRRCPALGNAGKRVLRGRCGRRSSGRGRARICPGPRGRPLGKGQKCNQNCVV